MAKSDYLNDKELERLEMCKLLHQCPWWRRLFPKHKDITFPPHGFIFHTSHSSGIGRDVQIECVWCGKTYDITDYSCW